MTPHERLAEAAHYCLVCPAVGLCLLLTGRTPGWLADIERRVWEAAYPPVGPPIDLDAGARRLLAVLRADGTQEVLDVGSSTEGRGEALHR